VPDEMMLNTAMPDRLPAGEDSKYPDLPDGVYWTAFSATNDAHISEEEREQQLRQLAKDSGFQFRFID
jgi:hypothetical protein